eukprot:scaffold72217_cov59-Phaeocystis_antarctica.AAC.2
MKNSGSEESLAVDAARFCALQGQCRCPGPVGCVIQTVFLPSNRVEPAPPKSSPASRAARRHLSVHIITPAIDLQEFLCGSVPAWLEGGSGRAFRSTTRPGPSAHLVSQSTRRLSSTQCCRTPRRHRRTTTTGPTDDG